ncbi:MAG: DUF4143 domain-containing protein [Bacteroidetes bacterium]|nr:DUF4143 domain-containing protein [Bacteroidota bacterium]
MAIRKNNPLYFTDTGLLCHLLSISTNEQLESHYLRGNIFENLVFIELMKHKLNQTGNQEFFFWRDKTGNEVDLVIVDGERVTPVEIKAGRTLLDFHFRGLMHF